MATLLFVLRTSWWDCPRGRWRGSGWRWGSSVWRGWGCKWPLSVLSVPWTACKPSGHPERRRQPWLPLSQCPVRLSLRRLRCLHSGWADHQRIEPFWKRTDPKGKIQSDVSGNREETHHNKHISSKPECAALCDWKIQKVASFETALLCFSPFIHPLRRKLKKKRIEKRASRFTSQRLLKPFHPICGSVGEKRWNEMTADQPVSACPKSWQHRASIQTPVETFSVTPNQQGGNAEIPQFSFPSDHKN